MFSQAVVLVYGTGPDNPLSENVFEWKGLGWAEIYWDGVNATLPQNAEFWPAPWPASTSVVQAFLYVNIIYVEGNASQAIYHVAPDIQAVIDLLLEQIVCNGA